MITETLKKLFNRDLIRLKLEIESYQNDNAIWHFENQISNSAGNLCLHIIGNLNTFIGAVYRETGYIRNRELEFNLKNLSKVELISKIEDVIIVVNNALDSISEEEMQKEYPLTVFDSKTSTEFMLIHLTTHLAYHLGQINYHRRLLDIK